MSLLRAEGASQRDPQPLVPGGEASSGGAPGLDPGADLPAAGGVSPESPGDHAGALAAVAGGTPAEAGPSRHGCKLSGLRRDRADHGLSGEPRLRLPVRPVPAIDAPRHPLHDRRDAYRPGV